MEKLEGGEVNIIARKYGRIIKISVIDNGEGIEEKELKNLLESNAKRESIGLINVHTRLQLIYGEEYGLDIKSNKNEGTVVTISIPEEGEIWLW